VHRAARLRQHGVDMVHSCVCACAGLPFRASCCWNGMAVLKAAPFKAGVRIRPPMKDECQVCGCVDTELLILSCS
jgi:hypothetical protein